MGMQATAGEIREERVHFSLDNENFGKVIMKKPEEEHGGENREL